MGDKWLTTKFNERLESYKHEQQRQLEQLKFTINTMLDRTVKLHQQEFEVLPELWALLTQAHGHVRLFLGPSPRSPDLDRMPPAQFEDFLSKSQLSEDQKAELRSAPGKAQRYAQMTFRLFLQSVNDTLIRFSSYFVEKGIFLQPELTAAITEFQKLMLTALIERQVDEDGDLGPCRFETSQKLSKELDSKLDALGEAVRIRLWALPTIASVEK